MATANTMDFRVAFDPLNKVMDSYKVDLTYINRALDSLSESLKSSFDSVKICTTMYDSELKHTFEAVQECLAEISKPILSEEQLKIIQKSFDLKIKIPEHYFIDLQRFAIGDEATQQVVAEEDAPDDLKLSDDEQSEFQTDLKDLQLTAPNCEQRIAATVKKWGAKHPVLAWILCVIVMNTIASIIGGCILNALTRKETRIYEEPSSKSEVVLTVAGNQVVRITGDESYYYEVETDDNGIVIKGYIYKGNVDIPDEEAATD